MQLISVSDPLLVWTAPNGIAMCQVEVVVRLTKEAVRDRYYPSWPRYVKKPVSVARRQCRGATGALQTAAPRRDDQVLREIVAGGGRTRGLRRLPSLGTSAQV